MTIVLRPLGRGNWKPVLLVIDTDSRNAPLPLEFYVGQQVQIAGHVFRVSRMLP